MRNECISLVLELFFEHWLGSQEVLEIGNVVFIRFHSLFCFFFYFPRGNPEFVADLDGDVPGPWEGVGGGYPPLRI